MHIHSESRFIISSVSRHFLILLSKVVFPVLLVSWNSYANILPSLCEAELTLHSDSSDAAAWGRYGLALLADGEDHAEWVLQNGLSFGNSSESLRGLASLAVQSGNYEEAIELLEQCSGNNSTDIMLCSVLQESGCITEADSLLKQLMASGEVADETTFLRIRQYRCSSLPQMADSLAAILLNGNVLELSPLIKLDLLLSGDSTVKLDSSEILTAVRTDIILTGSVYRNRILSSLASTDMQTQQPLQTARILALLGEEEEAERVISSKSVEEMSLDELVFYSELLLELYKLNQAESVVRTGLDTYPDSPALFKVLGMTLLRGGRYQDTYQAMSEAVELTGSTECMAVMGLAAEYAGEFILAVNAYSPLLEMSADSIVLINRTRNWFREDQLETLTESNVWENGNSPFSGNISLSYYKSTGEYPQENASLGGSIWFRYGLYNSSVSASTRFSNNNWPGLETSLKNLYVSASWRNYSSRNLFQSINVSWDHSRDETTRWKLSSIASCGYSFDMAETVWITPSVGVGKIINRWDDEIYQRDSYVYNPGVTITYSGRVGEFRPGVTLSGDISCDFADSDQYEVGSQISLNAALNSLLSLSYSYRIDYQSIVPPENESELNTSTNASLYFHF